MIRAYGHQQIFDFVHNTIQGMDKNSAKAILQMVNRMVDAFRTRADDVANWPNVRSLSVVIEWCNRPRSFFLTAVP
jgi:hypothetical protein